MCLFQTPFIPYIAFMEKPGWRKGGSNVVGPVQHSRIIIMDKVNTSYFRDGHFSQSSVQPFKLKKKSQRREVKQNTFLFPLLSYNIVQRLKYEVCLKVYTS